MADRPTIKEHIATTTSELVLGWTWRATTELGQRRAVAVLTNCRHWAFGFEFGGEGFFSLLLGPLALITIRMPTIIGGQS